MDPVKAGIVTSLARPEANVPGLATLNDELWQKRLGMFKQIAPKVSRVAVLWNPANPGNGSCLDEIKAAAPALGLQVTSQEVRDATALEQALGVIAKERPDALVMCWDSVTLAQARRIAEFALAATAADVGADQGIRRGGQPDVARRQPAGAAPARGVLRRQGAEGRQARITSGRTTAAVRPRDQSSATAKALGLAPSPGVLILADDLIQ